MFCASIGADFGACRYEVVRFFIDRRNNVATFVTPRSKLRLDAGVFRLLPCRMPRISARVLRKPKHFIGSRMETALH